MKMPTIAIRGVLLLVFCFMSPARAEVSASEDLLVFGNQRIGIEYQTRLNDAERGLTRRWVKTVAEALMTVYGELPEQAFQVVIRRSQDRSDPVPWGQVDRDDPTTVLLVMNPDVGYERLIGDWTAFHEFCHLLLPYRGHGDVWYSEGLATYYQNLIQARGGFFDEGAMWAKLASGFERGAREQRWSDRDLTEVSDNLSETRQYMRVHWSGVLYWLNADVALRKQGKGTLDDALKKLKDCCEDASLSAPELARRLDGLMRTRLFLPLFEQYRKSFRLLEYRPLLAELGVAPGAAPGAVVLDDTAPLARIRRQIFRKNR